jgi:hypothetical protein
VTRENPGRRFRAAASVRQPFARLIGEIEGAMMAPVRAVVQSSNPLRPGTTAHRVVKGLEEAIPYARFSDMQKNRATKRDVSDSGQATFLFRSHRDSRYHEPVGNLVGSVEHF